MRHPDYPVWNFLALVLVLLPAPWHWRAKNIATMALVLWLAICNLVGFVNTLVWANDYIDRSPIWCDISSRVSLLAAYAVPLCSLSLMRRLESVASTRRSVITVGSRTKRIWEEVILCVVCPVILAVLQYVVQGHRYDIIESIGCNNPTFMSAPGLIIRYVIPIVLSVSSLVFAALAVRWFLIRRLQFRAILAASDSNLSISRYIRLIALAVTDSTVVLVAVVYSSVSALTDDSSPMEPYTSWSSVHSDFGQVSQFPEELFASSWVTVVLIVYAPILYSILFFTFFGFGEEAIVEYLAFGERVVLWMEKIGLKQKSFEPAFGTRPLNLGSKVVPAVTASHAEGVVRDDVSEKCFQGLESRSDLAPLSHGSVGVGGITVKVERSVV
ncbi:hypothetical protein L198_04149 [Cryptococcus wingfieldii CBS 7118]|uniref:STE3 n=1 Tax=Cryptococcus wingfieldii CBS 7118 TaxID=1295528 RepID=A0A1E3J6X8_9TREE|nr:hypothetical protein L198_04149 [Cryptococcus wingfieldii CBS 7118]ODN96435.1 hypothetical protein L198_04149 [Cryptococcus wingfieldii CBS 7118]